MTIGREGANIEYEGIGAGGNERVASAYLAKPASELGCGIVVIHDEWGLTEFIRDACDRLARAGFVALAPDLFHGRIADDRATAEQLSKELDREGVDADLESTVAELFNQHSTTGAKVGALGLGLGGSLALPNYAPLLGDLVSLRRSGGKIVIPQRTTEDDRKQKRHGELAVALALFEQAIGLDGPGTLPAKKAKPRRITRRPRRGRR